MNIIYDEKLQRTCCVCMLTDKELCEPNYVAEICINKHDMCRMCLIGVWCNHDDPESTPPCAMCREPMEVMKSEVNEFIGKLEELHYDKHYKMTKENDDYKNLYCKKLHNLEAQIKTMEEIAVYENRLLKSRRTLAAEKGVGTKIRKKLDKYEDEVSDENVRMLILHMKKHRSENEVWYGNVFSFLSTMFHE